MRRDIVMRMKFLGRIREAKEVPEKIQFYEPQLDVDSHEARIPLLNIFD